MVENPDGIPDDEQKESYREKGVYMVRSNALITSHRVQGFTRLSFAHTEYPRHPIAKELTPSTPRF